MPVREGDTREMTEVDCGGELYIDTLQVQCMYLCWRWKLHNQSQK